MKLLQKVQHHIVCTKFWNPGGFKT